MIMEVREEEEEEEEEQEGEKRRGRRRKKLQVPREHSHRSVFILQVWPHAPWHDAGVASQAGAAEAPVTESCCPSGSLACMRIRSLQEPCPPWFSLPLALFPLSEPHCLVSHSRSGQEQKVCEDLGLQESDSLAQPGGRYATETSPQGFLSLVTSTCPSCSEDDCGNEVCSP